MPHCYDNCVICNQSVREDNYARHLRTHVNDCPLPDKFAGLKSTPIYGFAYKQTVEGVEHNCELFFCQACGYKPTSDRGFVAKHKIRKPECFTEEGMKKCVKPRKYPKKTTEAKGGAGAPKVADKRLVSEENITRLREILEYEEDEETDETIDNLLEGLFTRLQNRESRIKILETKLGLIKE